MVEEGLRHTRSGAKVLFQVEWNRSALGRAVRVAAAISAANGEVCPSCWVETSTTRSRSSSDTVGGRFQEVYEVQWTAVDSGKDNEKLQHDTTGCEDERRNGEDWTCVDMSCCLSLYCRIC